MISLSVCTCIVRMYALQPFSDFSSMCVAVRRRAKFFFSDGSLFCLLVRIECVFVAHVRVCTLENDHRSVYMLHGCIFSPKNMHPCNIYIKIKRVYVSTRIRKMPVWEIFRKMAPIPGNVRTYPKVCVGKRLEYR